MSYSLHVITGLFFSSVLHLDDVHESGIEDVDVVVDVLLNHRHFIGLSLF